MDTVLVIEDSRLMQRTLQRLFEANSLQVQIASDGPSGLEFFLKQLPCAAVLDLNLPGISGKELCREFKALVSSVPILILSASSEVNDKVLLLELGADDYVTEPIQSERALGARVPCNAPHGGRNTDRLTGCRQAYRSRGTYLR